MADRPLQIGRLTFYEPWKIAVNEERVHIEGQESSPPATTRQMETVVRDLTELENVVVPVVFGEKGHLDGYYLANNCNADYDHYGSVRRMNWTIDLDRQGRPNDVLHQSLISVVTLDNDHAIVSPQAAHAPPIGTTRYTPPLAWTDRQSAVGTFRVGLGIEDASDPKWTIPPASYYTGAVEITDVETVRQGLSVDGAPHQVTVANGLLEAAVDADGRITVRHYTAPHLDLDGAAGDYASTPDTATLDIVGDIDLRADVALDNWANGSTQALVAKYDINGDQRSYGLLMAGSGHLVMQWSEDGVAFQQLTSSAVVPAANGHRTWVRATLDVDNGAAGADARFYTSTDGTSWTELGTVQTHAAVTSIFAGSAVLSVGARDGGTGFPAAGRFYEAAVYDGIAGTVVANPTVTADGIVDATGLVWTGHGSAATVDEWAAAKEYTVTRDTVEVGGWATVTVLVNKPEYCAVRYEQQIDDTTGDGAFTLDMMVRRGMRHAAFLLTSTDAGTLKVARTTAEAATSIVGGVRATGNDDDGNRYVIASAKTATKDLATGGLSIAATTILDFAIATEVGGTTANADGDQSDDLVAQYLGWVAEEVRTVRR